MKTSWSGGLLARWFPPRATEPLSPASQELRSAIGNNGHAQSPPHSSFSGDSPEAIERVGNAAAGGDVTAQNSMGSSFASGTGVLRNDAEARKWFRRAAEQGDVEAQFSLGNLCHSASMGGEGGEARIEAYMWFHIAAAQGHAKAQASCDMLNLGMTDAELDEGKRRARAFQPRKEGAAI